VLEQRISKTVAKVQ